MQGSDGGNFDKQWIREYLGGNYATVREAVADMALDAAQQIDDLLGSALKKVGDASLFLALALRGYDHSDLRRVEAPTATEIVKIG